jgi:hypothetical protein
MIKKTYLYAMTNLEIAYNHLPLLPPPRDRVETLPVLRQVVLS